MTKPTPQPGSVSRGTMRPEDLIPTFIDLVEQYAPEEVEGLDRNVSPQDEMYLLDELFDFLDGISPPDCYFGSHPGDGADFGWWPIEGDDDDEYQTDRPDVPD